MYYVHEPVDPTDEPCQSDPFVTGGPLRCKGPTYQAHIVWADINTCICWRACQAHLPWGLLFMGAEGSTRPDPYQFTVTPLA